jgi:hypothetical protein
MAQEAVHTRFSDIVVNDPAISMAAKGIFVTIGFLGNGCALQALLNHTKDTEALVESALQELTAAGYVTIDEGHYIHIRSAATFGIIS